MTGVGSIYMSGDINGVERIYCSGVVAETGSKMVTIYNGGNIGLKLSPFERIYHIGR